MRTRSHRRAVAYGLFTISTCLILFAAGGAPSAKTAGGRGDAPAVQCPPPTEKLGNQCVLKHDASLEKTLRLSSDTKLNCQGHKLTPKVPARGSRRAPCRRSQSSSTASRTFSSRTA
jgi:hypothetical protein